MRRPAGPWLLPVAILLMSPGWSEALPPLRIVLPFYLEGKVPRLVTAQPLKPEPGDDELRKLLKERYNAALAEVKAWYADIFGGPLGGPKFGWPRDDMLDAAFRALETELELSDKPEDHLRVRQEQLDWAKQHEKVVGLKYEAGRLGMTDVARARYIRANAEIKLVQVKRKAAAGWPK